MPAKEFAEVKEDEYASEDDTFVLSPHAAAEKESREAEHAFIFLPVVYADDGGQEKEAKHSICQLPGAEHDVMVVGGEEQ